MGSNSNLTLTIFQYELDRITELVNLGRYPNRNDAIRYFIRKGLEAEFETLELPPIAKLRLKTGPKPKEPLGNIYYPKEVKC